MLTICNVEPSRASNELSEERVEGHVWYVYMLKCQDGAIYTGFTDDIARRFKEHAQGQGGHYTNCNRPKDVLYKESFKHKFDAEQREQQIKGWSRAKKLALVGGDKNQLRNLSKSRD